MRGIGEWSENVEGNEDTRYDNWEECAQRCRQNNFCTHWVVEVGYYFMCYLRQGTYHTGSPTYDYSRYILGYKDCTPGKNKIHVSCHNPNSTTIQLNQT